MKINRDNYEEYFLDYHEGQLSPDMVEEVLRFVENNPDLKQVFVDFETVSLIADQDIVFETKSLLKKNQVFATSRISELNVEEYLIRETEGMLDTAELASLDEFISINPQFEMDRKLYGLAHMPIEKNIVFTAKESLKQKAIPVGAINTETYETFLVRDLENDLSQEEKHQLSEFMQYNAHLESEKKLFALTVLSPERDIIFENKNSLKQTATPVRRIILYTLAAAATLAMFLSVSSLFDRNDIPDKLAINQGQANQPEKVITDAKPGAKIDMVGSKDKSFATVSPVPVRAASVVSPGYDQAVLTNNLSAEFADAAIRNPVSQLSFRPAHAVSTRQYVDPQFTFIRVSQMYMNLNTELYYNIKLSEQIQYAQLNSKDKNPVKTIYQAAAGKADELFAFNSKTTANDDRKNLSLWTFAELGVQTFNKVTSSELELNLQKDEEGKVVSYGIESGLIDFEKDIKE